MSRYQKRSRTPLGSTSSRPRLLWVTSTVGLVGLVAACDRGPTGGPNDTPASSAAPGSVEVDLGKGGAAYDERDLAVPPDFEAEADREITKDNYRAQLEAIEIEMDASVPEKTDGDAGAPRPDAASAPDGGPRKRRPLPEPL